MILIIGGKLDGTESPLATVSFEEKGEQYILIEFKEKHLDKTGVWDGSTSTHRFFMVAEMAPADAMKQYRVRNGFEKLDIHGKKK